MQKRISEHLRENFAGKYQTGLLASFESYVPSTLSDKEHATFDGDDEERKEDAKDDSVIGQLINSYQQEFNHMPPHPKMDWVVKQLHEQIYTYGKKQLIFVRRVASVSELKRKFEEHYDNAFIGEYIQNDAFVREMHRYYLANKYNGLVDIDLAPHEAENAGGGECASDDFFAWFYRGRNGYIEKIIDERKSSNNDGRWVTPTTFVKKLPSVQSCLNLTGPSYCANNRVKVIQTIICVVMPKSLSLSIRIRMIKNDSKLPNIAIFAV